MAVSRPEFIFVASIMGTGTGFVLQFLQASPIVAPKRDALNVMKGGFARDGEIHLIHAHFDGYAALSWDAIRAFAALASHVVVPVRDPLLVLLLAHRRKTIGPDFFPAWRNLVELVGAHDPRVLPVDLLASVKLHKRTTALELAGKGYVPHDLCEKWSDWPVVNSHGDYDLRILYNEGDVDAIQAAIPAEDWTALRDLEPDLRPFLETLGYKKLMWWHDV